MPVLEFRTADLGRIVVHALAATDDREGFNDDGSGAGLILVANLGGVYLMSNGTPALCDSEDQAVVAYAVGADPRRDPDWSDMVVELVEPGAGEFKALCNWARMIRHISRSAELIRVRVEDGSAELLYDPPSVREPENEEIET